MHQLQELVRLHRLGTGAREVARLLKVSPTTERGYRKALAAAGLLAGSPTELPPLVELKKAVATQKTPSKPKQERSSVEAWRPKVEELLVKGLKARAIYDRLRTEEAEFTGSLWAVRRLVKQLKRAKGVEAKDVAIRVETGPGEVAQVDFGQVGKLLCPESHVLRRAWVFVMVLSNSRHMYAEVVFDQKIETWIEVHRRAFEWFGGVPKTIVPDNLKAAMTRTAFGIDGDKALCRSYREVARYYGFKVDPTPPYAPKKKGKVESAVKYVKNNILAGRDGEELTALNGTLWKWLKETAGQRIHGTTGRKPLIDFCENEMDVLRPLPSAPYQQRIWKQAKVHQDCHISFQGRMYSVPWRWIGKQVWVEATPATVAIYGEDTRIATHSRSDQGKWSTNDAHLPEHRRDLRHRSRTYWEKRAQGIGPETLQLVKEVFDSDEVLSQLRKVQAIVTHLEGFPVSRAEAASRRASFYGICSYQGVKNILAKALDFEPLPIVLQPSEDDESTYQFARNGKELLASAVEVHSEPH